MTVPLWLRVFAVVLGLLLATPLLVSGVAGMRGSLHRGSRLGVGTPEARRSDAAFELANRAAAVPALVAGGIAAVGGLLCLALPGTATVVTVLVLTVVGALVIATVGNVLGHRAAAALPPPQPVAGGCSGCLCGGAGCGG